MGDVHLARPLDPSRGLPTPIVVKRLHPELSTRRGFVARFRHEAAVAVSVDSLHVAKVYDVGSVGETLYISMEYIQGWPLSEVLDAVLKSGRHASVASVVDLVAGGLEGLIALHRARDPKTNKPLDIVHRDLSPKNLMVGEDGVLRLIDLGLGKSKAQDWRTRTGVVMGSVGYMPPEQARGERVDARADIYALGVVAFEMLALRNYVKRGPVPDMMERSKGPKFVRPSEFRPDVPRELDAVIERALKPDPSQRYSSAASFLNDLRRAVPPVYTDGGMAILLDELFGAAKLAREKELAELFAYEPPQELDEFETKPTKVFVVRDGVVPLDASPTEYARSPTAVKVQEGVEEAPTQHVAHPDPALPQPATEVTPSLQSSQGDFPGPSASMPLVQPVVSSATGVTLPMLVLAVVVAALLGGVVSAVTINAMTKRSQPVAVQPEAEPVPRPTSTPVPRPRPVAQPNPDESVAEVRVPKTTKAPRRKVRPRKMKEKAAPAPPRPATAAERAQALNDKLDALKTELVAAKDRARTRQDKDRVDQLAGVLYEISTARRGEGLEFKQRIVRKARALASRTN